MMIENKVVSFDEAMEALIEEYSELEVAEYFGPRVLFNALIDNLNKSIEALEGVKDAESQKRQSKLVDVRDKLVLIYQSKHQYL